MAHYLKQELYELIKEDERIFDFIQEGSLDGLWYWDLEKPENEWMNPRFWEVLGYDPAEMPHLASAWQDIINQDDLEVAQENFQKHAADPKHPYDQEVRYIHKNGSTVWIRCRGIIVRDKGNKPIRMLGAHQDITTIKRDKNLLDQIIEQSPFATRISDDKGVIQRINSAQEKLIGVPKEEFIGKYNVLEDKIVEKAGLMPKIKSVFEKGEVIDFTLEWDGKDLSDLEFSQANKVTGRATMFPVFTDEGKLSNVVVHWLDITKEIEAQNKVKVSEAKYKAIYNNAPLAIQSLDIAGKILEVNPKWLNILQYDEKDVIGKWFGDFLHPGSVEHFRERFSQLIAEGSYCEAQYRMKKKGGEYIHVLFEGCIAYTPEATFDQTYCTFIDISEQKEAEMEIKEQRDLFETVINSVPDRIFWKNKNSVYLGCNGNFAKDAGMERIEDIIGKTDYDLVWKEHAELYIADDLEVIQSGRPKLKYEEPFVNSKGKQIWLTNKIPLKNNQGEIMGMVATSENITRRKKTEAALFESEERLRLITDNVNLGLWDLNLKTGELYLNDNWYNIAGYEPGEVEGSVEWWQKQLMPEDKKKTDLLYEAHLKGESSVFKAEYRVKTKTGNWIWVQDMAKVVERDEKNNALRIVGIHTDITQQKEDENRIRESEEKLRLSIDNSPLGICISSLDGNFTSSNEAYEQIVGYTKKELKELSFFDITHPDYLPENRTIFESMVKNETSGFDIEKKYIRKDGSLIDVKVHSGTICDKDGKPMFAMAFVEDITETNTLLNRNKMLYKAVESSPVSVIITDEEGIIEYVNPFFTEITGYTRDEAIGKNPRILKGERQEEDFYKEMWDTITSGRPWSGEFYNRKKNGEFYWENAIISPLFNSKNEINQFVAIKEDITELKDILTELKLAKEKAEEANALKTEFLQNMSHEIRTPMNGIMGFSNIISKPDLSTEKRNYYTQIIRNSSQQLLRIIDDILEISSLETKQLTTLKSEFDIQELIMELFAVYDLRVKEKNLKLSVSNDLPREISTLCTDKSKLIKILGNLLDNAFKFTSIGNIELGVKLKNSNILFFVKDSGIGISADRKEKIFERFSQESPDTAKSYGGIGLGLAIASENTKLLGGTLTVESEKGKGATFFIEIPFTKPEYLNENNEPPIKPDYKINTMVHILIAEDEEVNYLYLEEVIKSGDDLNFQLSHAVNGKDAVEKSLSDDKIDMVLMDIKMPVMDGYIATEKIKAVKPDLPVIAQTAYSTVAEKNKALEHGCDDFISKPITEKELLAVIKKHLPKSSGANIS